MLENRKYMIFSVSEISNINFDEVLETSQQTLAKSTDETKTFVKWDGEGVPTSVQNLTTKEGPYTYTEFLQIINSPFWTPIT